MPRPLLIIFVTVLLIRLLIPSPTQANSELVFIEGGENNISLADNAVLLNLPEQALANPSRVSLAEVKDVMDLPPDSFSPVYSWQVLDALVLQPLSLKIKFDASASVGVQAWQRANPSQNWQPADFNLKAGEIDVVITEEAGQVVLAEFNLTPFRLTLDQATVSKGYQIKTPDDYFGFYIMPDAFVSPVTIEVNPLSASIYPPPPDLKLVSPVYHFKINVDDDYIIPKDLPVEIKFFPGETNSKEIYYWNNLDNKWEPSPSLTRYQDGVVRTLTHQKEMILAVMSNDIMEKGVASWYKYKRGDFAASPDYPKGTELKVTNIDNGRSVVISVNDYGPDRAIHPDRVIDLDYVAFKKIASPGLGLITVSVEKIFY